MNVLLYSLTRTVRVSITQSLERLFQRLQKNGHTVAFHDLYAERFEPHPSHRRNPKREPSCRRRYNNTAPR